MLAERLCTGLEDAEFAIPGQIIADVAVRAGPRREADGAATVTIEALTIEE